MSKVIFLLICLISSSKVFSVECNYSEVIAIQLEDSNLLALVSSNGEVYWKRIGLTSSDITKSYQSLLQQALAMTSRVMFYYEEQNYVCDVSDYSNVPNKIR
ncbi:hypothetical protein BIZ38_02375, partial [Pseudoalteromonas sp. BZK2]|uniref:hypothetical protein n=1 Tax=Pseudoalteromonas sp. BZK2 TaxID=1904458 RepID=UPI001654538E